MAYMTQMYNDRRLFFGGGPGIGANDSFGSAASGNSGADGRNSRSRGILVLKPFYFFLLSYLELQSHGSCQVVSFFYARNIE